jgi:nucleoside-diphosphate-sugar epimerase
LTQTFLITGVTGFLGSALANKLLQNGYKVVGIGRSEDTKGLEKHHNFRYFRGEISSDNLSKLNDYNLNGIFHLASLQPSKSDYTYDDYHKNNVLSTTILINYFKNKPLSFFVYTSTISVFGEKKFEPIDENSFPQPTNFYGLTKYISEKILSIESNEMNTKVVILRLQSIFGKNDGYGIIHTFYDRFKKNLDVELYSNGIIHRNLISLSDTLEVLKSIIDKHSQLNKFEIFHVASSNSLRTLDIAKIIKDYLSSKSKIICLEKKYIYDWDIHINLFKLNKVLNFYPKSLQDSIILYLKEKSNEL